MSEFECSYFISQSSSYKMSISISSEYGALSVCSVFIWQLFVIQEEEKCTKTIEDPWHAAVTGHVP
jgi:hypothetical protein